MPARYLLVASEEDPVARGILEQWGTPPATGASVEGAPIRELDPGVFLLRRPGRHIFDEDLDRKLPGPFAGLPMVFPSIHSSERGVPSFTVHPLGNPGASAEVGGFPRTLVPTAPRLMAAALRGIAERAPTAGLPVCLEATHHGPRLGAPALFAEIGCGGASAPSAEALRVLADALRDLVPDPGDRVALGVGGGHYAPHFTELARTRRWAFGHLISRHALLELDRRTAEAAYSLTPGADGIVFTRAEDAADPRWQGIGPRLGDSAAPRREASAASRTGS